MFGYTEPCFSVLDTRGHPCKTVPTQQFHYELRAPVASAWGAARAEPIPYIALWLTDAEGTVLSDILLIYDDGARAREDWAHLIGPEVVHLEDLRYIERIDDHYMGRSRSGCVTMY